MGIFKRENYAYFGGAKGNRLLSNWILSEVSIDRKLYSDLKGLRARARNLVHESPMMARYVNVMRSNIIGSTGIKLQMKIMDLNKIPDMMANDIVERNWEKWGRTCGTKGESWIQNLLLSVDSYSIDGEIFCRHFIHEGNVALECIDANRVDTLLNKAKDSQGPEIRMGIELDEYGKPTGYWLKQKVTDYRIPWEQIRGNYIRIPAEEMTHIFFPTEPGQTRGYPPIAPVMNTIHQLNGLNEATLVSARAVASQMAFLEKPPGGGKWTGKDDDGNPEIKIEPLALPVLPAGWKVQAWNPKGPEIYEPFARAMKLEVAVGCGISYPAISGDLSAVNFSSIRAGNMQDQEYFKTIQRIIIDRLVYPIFEKWLKVNLINGNLKPLPFTKYNKFNSPVWSCKRWPYVNPTDEASARQTELQMGIKSRTQMIEESGGDVEDVFRQLQQEQQLAQQLQIKIGDGSNGTKTAPSPGDEKSAPGEDGKTGSKSQQ